MNIDRIDLFEALAQHDIRVARSAYVDSPEGALAFAGRRTAPDARLVPIRLLGVFPGVLAKDVPAFSESPFSDPESIEDAYRRIGPKTIAAGGRVLAQAATEPGTDMAVACRIDAALGKIIAVGSTAHSVQHLIPLDAAGAATLAASIQAYEHRGSREQVRRMLEHLLIRVARFFDASGLERLDLNPLRLHANSYTVLDAVAAGAQPLAVRHVDAGARDRKGHYHPSGRQ